MNASDLKMYYSGGSSNTDPDASLGGIRSSTAIGGQTMDAFSSITGVTLLDIGGVLDGDATFYYYSSNKTLLWKPPGGVQGPAVSFLGVGSGVFLLESAGGAQDGYVLLSVVEASLPASNTVESLEVSTPSNELFDDILAGDAATGITKNRCLYLRNDHGSESLVQFFLYIASQTPGADMISIAVETSKVGDGSSTGVAITIADEEDSTNQLDSLTFTSPSDLATAINVSETIANGESIPIWIRCTVPPLVTDSVEANAFSLAFNVHQEV